MVSIAKLKKIEKVTRKIAIGGILTAASFLVPTAAVGRGLVFGKGLIARALPKALPAIKTGALRLLGKVTLKRAIIGSVVAGAALESPTIRGIIKKAPTAPFKTGKRLGAFVEKEIAPEEEESPIKKALKIGGVVGLAGAAALVGVKKLKERKAAKVAATGIAAVPLSTAQAIPLTPLKPAVLPPAEIISPTAVVEPKKVKRAPRTQRGPLVINQIQFST